VKKKRNSSFVDSLNRAKKFLGVTDKVNTNPVVVPSENTPVSLSPSLSRFNKPSERETSLINRIKDLVSNASVVEYDGKSMTIPNFNFPIDETIETFTREATEIDTRYQTQLAKIDFEKKEHLLELETKILIDVKLKIKEEKTLAIKSFVDRLSGLIDPLVVSSPSLADTNDNPTNAISNNEDDDTPTCTICRDDIVKIVTLPCNHSFCFDCMAQFVQDKINGILRLKKRIEDLVIYCPNWRSPMLYLDDFDGWLTDNEFDVAAMWGID